MNESIQDCVNRGVILLNEREPGWLDRIDLDRLSLSSLCNCVLGQVLGGYDSDYVEDDYKYGFDTTTQIGECSELTACWKQKILELREQK